MYLSILLKRNSRLPGKSVRLNKALFRYQENDADNFKVNGEATMRVNQEDDQF